MAQRTLVVKLPVTKGPALRERLARAGLEFRDAPHVAVGARRPGLVVTLYTSGKLVLQGEDPEAFLASHLDGVVALPGAAPGERGAPAARSDAAALEVTIGSDESGKGDYFGPLVVAAVRLEPDLARALSGGEVRDCKELADATILRLGGALRGRVPHAIARLDPPAYNATHARVGNLNPMLARLHAQAIGELAGPGVRVVVDQFAAERVLQSALADLDVRLEQRHRAESSEIAVAAASVIAREEFLLALAELSETWAVDLAKGAGAPTDRAARRFVELHGADKLGEVAKLHFRTTQKVTGGAPRRGAR